jgi:4-hydroxy-tetrahydrodipicolinate reductase
MTSQHPIRLVVNGAQGKMGARIAALAQRDARFHVVAAIDREDAARAAALTPDSVDAIIDFSSDEGARSAARLAIRVRCALLVGTTGLSHEAVAVIDSVARCAPLMIAANTSLGVAVLNHLVAEAARLLGSEYQIFLTEVHHTMKRDAPSGTALRIKQALRDKAGIDLPPERIHSIRTGEVIGDHALEFAGPLDVIKISHSAISRDLFAAGALRAAAWLHGRPPGRYTIEQSFGLA